MYICREDGEQVSSNFTREADGSWRKDESFRKANWVWRPYFLPNINTMKNRQIGLLSQPYTDLDSPNMIQTFSCPIGGGCYAFIDLEGLD